MIYLNKHNFDEDLKKDISAKYYVAEHWQWHLLHYSKLHKEDISKLILNYVSKHNISTCAVQFNFLLN